MLLALGVARGWLLPTGLVGWVLLGGRHRSYLIQIEHVQIGVLLADHHLVSLRFTRLVALNHIMFDA